MAEASNDSPTPVVGKMIHEIIDGMDERNAPLGMWLINMIAPFADASTHQEIQVKMESLMSGMGRRDENR